MDILELLNKINTSHEAIFIIIRAILTYFIAIFLIRINVRIHLETSFDFVLIIILGQILERGIFNDTTDFVMSISVSLLIVILYKIMSYTTFYSKFVGKFFKGKCYMVYRNGKFSKKTMEELQITKEDIMAACRKEINCDSLDNVIEVNLERTGKFSFIKS